MFVMVDEQENIARGLCSTKHALFYGRLSQTTKSCSFSIIPHVWLYIHLTKWVVLFSLIYTIYMLPDSCISHNSSTALVLPSMHTAYMILYNCLLYSYKKVSSNMCECELYRTVFDV